MDTQAKITVVGGRQAGKTYATLLYAICEAYQGRKVLWQGFSGAYASHCMRDAEELCKRLDMNILKARHANGLWGVDFPSGGRVDFRPPTRTRAYTSYDIHILDDVHDPNTQPLTTAERVIRTVCTDRNA